MSYWERVKQNMLPLSSSQSINEAFMEWHFSDHIVDHEKPTATCELCDNHRLRYHFEIINEITSESMFVGSECILRIGIPFFDGNTRRSKTESRQVIQSLMGRLQFDKCIQALTRLTETENSPISARALSYYRSNRCLTPKLAAIVLWRLGSARIPHCPEDFSVSIKRGRHREDLASLEDWQLRYIWPALTPSQRRKAIEMGHSSPSKESDRP